MHVVGGRRVRIVDLLATGLLRDGDELIFNRRRAGETHHGQVVASGRIRLADGEEYTSPSSAGRAVAGSAVDGWFAWTVTRTGSLLDALRQQHIDSVDSYEVGTEDGEPTSEGTTRRHAFLKAARDAADLGKPETLTVRELISRWGSPTRSSAVYAEVENDLANHGLVTNPNFLKVTLDTPVELRLAGMAADPPGTVTTSSDEDLPADRGLTVGNLPSALGGVEFVSPQSTFDEVITKMLLNDYSQLAVLTSPYNLRGVITWRSIAQARHDDRDARITKAVMPAETVSYDAELIDVLRRLYDDDFIFVKGPDNTVAGIVTAADVVLAYGDLSMPFLLVGQIDLLLRRLLGGHFMFEEVAAICDPEGNRDLKDFDDLTIGDYQRALEAPDLWERLDWHIDRLTFVRRLDDIRKLRNGIMHFEPDPLSEHATGTLRNFMLFLKRYVTSTTA